MTETDSKCQNQPCFCQRFKPAKDDKDNCLYCNHSIGFHEFINVDTKEHPFSKCKKCSCQRFKDGRYDPLICHYCGHYDGFHVNWSNTTTSSSTANSKPTQSQQSTSPTRPTGNSSRVGRPIAEELNIDFLVCFDKVKSNKVPKSRTKGWFNLISKNLIRENVKFSKKDAPDTIYKKIRSSFNGRLDGQRFKLYSVYSGIPGKPKKSTVASEEFSYESIKLNMTRQNKKLYIGPCEYDIDSPSTSSADDYQNQLLNGIPPNSSNNGTDIVDYDDYVDYDNYANDGSNLS